MLRIIDHFLTDKQSAYLIDSYSNDFDSYVNDTYNFEGRELLIEHEKWLTDKLISQNILQDLRQIEIIRIQRVKENFEMIDEFHTHTIDRSFVCFINDDYEGGEFVFKNQADEQTSIKPTQNRLLIFDGDVPHKVNKVTKGTRFTLVCFYNLYDS
jgi:hypothetical protein